MKIAFVVHGFPPELAGGTERTVEALARAIKAQGHEALVICGSLQVAPVEQVDELDLDGLRVLRVHRDDLYFESWFKCYHPGVSATLERVFAAEQPDVVHVHHWLRLTSDIARLARAGGAVTAVTLHDYFAVLARVVRRVGEDQAAMPALPDYMPESEGREAFEFHRQDLHDELLSAQLRFVPSNAHGEGLARMAPGELGELLVTPPPLLDRPQPSGRRRDARRRRLLLWGSLYPDKGVHTVLSAMARVAGELGLRILGQAHDPAFQAHLEQLAKGLDVQFGGVFTHADLEQAEADFAVLPSRCHESYGLILDEALCLGLPVIAADLPAYREHAQEDACVFFAPGDVDALATLLQDEERLSALQVPRPPVLQTPAEAAADLIRHYEGVDRGGTAAPTTVTDRDRAGQLFRRAERRLWSMLQKGKPVLPPDEFLQT
ncbi:MAG: glycosyltransferase [Planctomycetota bacterium]|jgi:glycosyltransferase involved in cell wall biosynthesis